MKEPRQYGNYKKPVWAPPAWLFAPVWTVLYILIAITYGSALYLYIQGAIEWIVLVPFVLNLAFNFSFTPIQFGLRDFKLAAVDIVLTLITLVWAMVAIYPTASWITWLNIPYLLWVSFASVLQITITRLNT